MYQITNRGSIVRISDGACIPSDPRNTDYQKVLEWIAQGNTLQPYIQ